MNTDTLRSRLARRAEEVGSQKALASELGVSQAYLCDVMKGRKEPGPLLLAGLGLQRVVSYVVAE